MEKQDYAVKLVEEYLEAKGRKPSPSSVKVVWFCKTLQNWKAMIAHLEKGGMFFEVTYNGDKKETYIDSYVKNENVIVPDGD